MKYNKKEIEDLLNRANEQMKFGRVGATIAKELINALEQQVELLDPVPLPCTTEIWNKAQSCSFMQFFKWLEELKS